MQKVYKYYLKPDESLLLALPYGSKVLSSIEQHEKIVVYVLIDSVEERKCNYNFIVLGTGHSIEVPIDGYTFLSTIKSINEGHVYHVFYKQISLNYIYADLLES